MPLIKNTNSKIHIWKNVESPEELLSQLNNPLSYKDKVAKFKSKERIIQYLTTRLLVQNVIGEYEIKKGENNKPYIEKQGVEISFSHNKEFTILMVSSISCGVDVQKPTEKAIKVKSKFINEKDFCYHSNDLETLSQVWSCKEAAFKKYGTHEIYLKSNVSIIKQLSNNIYEAVVNINGVENTVQLKQEIIENNYLFFTLN